MGYPNSIKNAVIITAALFIFLTAACEEDLGPVLRPPTPSNLTAYVEGGSVRLRWNPTDPDEYRLERSDFISGNFREIARIEGDTEEYLDTDVAYGDTYYYRVRGYDEREGYQYPFSEYSNEVEVTVE